MSLISKYKRVFYVNYLPLLFLDDFKGDFKGDFRAYYYLSKLRQFSINYGLVNPFYTCSIYLISKGFIF